MVGASCTLSHTSIDYMDGSISATTLTTTWSKRKSPERMNIHAYQSQLVCCAIDFCLLWLCMKSFAQRFYLQYTAMPRCKEKSATGWGCSLKHMGNLSFAVSYLQSTSFHNCHFLLLTKHYLHIKSTNVYTHWKMCTGLQLKFAWLRTFFSKAKSTSPFILWMSICPTKTRVRLALNSIHTKHTHSASENRISLGSPLPRQWL